MSGIMVEAKTCQKPSKYFRGPCYGRTGTNRCRNLCVRREHLRNGFCNKSLKCVCTKTCENEETDTFVDTEGMDTLIDTEYADTLINTEEGIDALIEIN